ncbi:MAG TPA: transglycosylase SLT domain-containing protein [Burkholderiaceae bacterium]|nr:transglycosylase SLT domain-containing protein [Burkholderiaceae bacterium]
MPAFRAWARAKSAIVTSLRVFVTDLGHGLLAVGHNSLAVLGLAVLSGAILLGGRADMRAMLEERTLGWLLERQDERLADSDSEDLLDPGDVSAGDRATAADLSELNRQQATVAQWLARRYHVAPEPVARLVQEAWSLGHRVGLEPTLILAIVAIESSFNPFAQSAVGAQGLMQVMTKVHDDKYEAFGGNYAAFDPLTNLRVGVQVLKDCIAKAGSLEGGLRHYVGAANLNDDGGYAFKVLAEQGFMQQLLKGRSVPTPARLPVPPVGSTTAESSVPESAATAQPAATPRPSRPATPPAAAPNGSRKTERMALLQR